MIAHVAGVPLEEALLPLSGAGVWLLLARGWVAARLRRRGSHEALQSSQECDEVGGAWEVGEVRQPGYEER